MDRSKGEHFLPLTLAKAAGPTERSLPLLGNGATPQGLWQGAERVQTCQGPGRAAGLHQTPFFGIHLLGCLEPVTGLPGFFPHLAWGHEAPLTDSAKAIDACL